MSEPTRGNGLADEDTLRRQLDARRAELSEALRVLRESAAHTLAPRERFRRNPYVWLGAAAGIGFWMALRFRPLGKKR